MASSLVRPGESQHEAVRRHVLTPTVGIAIFGVVLALVGRFALTGVWAGMTGLWGVSLVLLAVVVRAAILLVRIT